MMNKVPPYLSPRLTCFKKKLFVETRYDLLDLNDQMLI